MIEIHEVRKNDITISALPDEVIEHAIIQTTNIWRDKMNKFELIEVIVHTLKENQEKELKAHRDLEYQELQSRGHWEGDDFIISDEELQ
jgi:hypothetical protein